MKDTRIWVCPALCGCEIEMIAEWGEDALVEGGRRVSYRHPVQGSIRPGSLRIVGVCPAHDSLRVDTLPADPYDGSPGYMKVPASPTEAENLYIHLFRYVGGTIKYDTCGCQVYIVHDRRGVEASKRIPHSRLTQKCPIHTADTPDHSTAHGENLLKNRVVGRILAANSSLTPDDVEWSFTPARVLDVDVPKLSAAAKTTLRATIAAAEGPGKVNLR